MKKIIVSTEIYKRLANTWHKWQVKINPLSEVKRCYYSTFKEFPNLDNPQDLIEKIYWLSLYSDTSLWTQCADKYRMREYVTSLGYESNLPILYGCWEDAKDINFDKLPSQFVIKTNNATETSVVVKDKNKIDLLKLKKQLNKWMKIKYGYQGAQLHYLRIIPKIIAEEYLVPDEYQKKISPNSLIDYKVFCCSGVPICVWVAYNRTHETGVDMNIYDMEWHSHPEWLNNIHHYTYKNVEIEKPACLEKIIEMCYKLSSPFPEVRLDFYVINGEPYIGELTFTSGYGFFTKEFYRYLGAKVDLSNVKKMQQK